MTGDPDWPVTWEANRRAQVLQAAGASPEQRLRWLERAIEVAAALGALDRARAREDAELREVWAR